MALRDLFPSRRKTHAKETGLPLFAARDRLSGAMDTDPERMLELSACAIRNYVFSAVLSGAGLRAEAVQDALLEVDMPVPTGRLRLATFLIDRPDPPAAMPLTEQLRQTATNLGNCLNRERFGRGEPRMLAHPCQVDGEAVCLLPLLEPEVPAEAFVDFLTRAAARMAAENGWHVTACLSEEFDDLSRLAAVYYDTRRIHELLADAQAPGPVWLAAEQRGQWEPQPDVPETVWWVEPMRAYVMANYANPELNISFLARQFGISPAYVGRKFREITGLGLLELIHRSRLTELDRRLAAGESVREAAAAVGYGSLLTMQRARERYRPEN